MRSNSLSRTGLTLLASACIVLGGLMIYAWLSFDGIPPRSALQAATGRLAWVDRTEYAVAFRLDGVPHTFEYSSKGNAMGRVEKALSGSDGQVVTVLFDPVDPRSPIFSDEAFFNVFEIVVEGEVIRSHEGIGRAWVSDNAIAAWLGGFFLLAGAWSAWQAINTPRRRR